MGARNMGARNRLINSSFQNKAQNNISRFLSPTELTKMSSNAGNSPKAKRDMTPMNHTSGVLTPSVRVSSSLGFRPRRQNIVEEFPHLRKKYEGGIWGYG